MTATRTSFVRAIASGAVVLSVIAARPHAAAAQTPDRASALEVRTRFIADLDTLQKKFVSLAEAFPAEKYTWRPGEGVRSVGEAFMHVASEYYVFTPMAYGATASPLIARSPDAFKKFEADASKESVLKHLNEGFAYMKAQIAGVGESAITGPQKLFGGDRTIIETSFIMSGDLHEHLGQLIAYARANGVVPPWSK